MKVTIIKDFKIAHDGITVTEYEKDAVHDLPDAYANRLIQLGAAEAVAEKSPVKENKAINPAEENKGKGGK